MSRTQRLKGPVAIAVAGLLICCAAFVFWIGRQRENEARRAEAAYLGDWFPDAANKPGLVLKPGGHGESYSADFRKGRINGFIRPFVWRASRGGLELAVVDEEGNPDTWRHVPCRLDGKAGTLEFAESPIFDVPKALYRN